MNFRFLSMFVYLIDIGILLTSQTATAESIMKPATAVAITQTKESASPAKIVEKPNIVLILLDDVGYAATEVFGGPVATPELKKLAGQGLSYNNFHTTALCAPTRAALLSGFNHHKVGFGSIPEGEKATSGYDMRWKKSTASVAEVLRENGYTTAAFGKWHNTPYSEITPNGPFEHWPTGLGFDYFYGFMSGEDSQWDPQLYLGTTAIDKPLSKDYHFTTDIANHAISWLHTRDAVAPEKPYFIYFAPGATHAPHHVPEAWIEKYRGHFNQGWDKLREEIFARQKKLGIIPATTKLTPRPSELPAWDSLSAEGKKVLARQMEAYAGFLAHTDFEVGRLLEAIRKDPQADNTLILYVVGDNGASGEGGLEGTYFHVARYRNPPTIQEQLAHLDGLGGPEYDNHYSAAWAWALATPFQWMKQIASHFGGTLDPLIAVWPKKIKAHGEIRSQFAHVNDVAPTLYEVAGIRAPAVVNGVKQQTLDGTSFAYTFDHPEEATHHTLQYFEMLGNRAIYKDGWVAATRHGVPWGGQNRSPYEEDRWELYHVAQDISEADDLAQKYPEKLQELKKLFDEEATRNNVLPLGGGPYRPPSQPLEFIYYSDVPRIPIRIGPQFSKSHRISIFMDIPKQGAHGVIMATGSKLEGGFAIYAKDDKLVFENQNIDGVSNTITTKLPRGKVELTCDFLANTPQTPQATTTVSGVTKLYINGELMGETNISGRAITPYFGSLGIDRAYDLIGQRQTYNLPSKFSGTLEKILVTLPPLMEGGRMRADAHR